jgi:hypothetical protein
MTRSRLRRRWSVEFFRRRPWDYYDGKHWNGLFTLLRVGWRTELRDPLPPHPPLPPNYRPETIAMQDRVFELRQQGLSWTKIGAEVDRAAGTCWNLYKQRVERDERSES